MGASDAPCQMPPGRCYPADRDERTDQASAKRAAPALQLCLQILVTLVFIFLMLNFVVPWARNYMVDAGTYSSSNRRALA